MSRPERTSVLRFLGFFACVALLILTPPIFAFATHHALVPEPVKLASGQVEPTIGDHVAALTTKSTPNSVTDRAERIKSHAAYERELRAMVMLLAVILAATTVLWMQTTTALRHWRIFSHDVPPGLTRSGHYVLRPILFLNLALLAGSFLYLNDSAGLMAGLAILALGLILIAFASEYEGAYWRDPKATGDRAVTYLGNAPLRVLPALVLITFCAVWSIIPPVFENLMPELSVTQVPPLWRGLIALATSLVASAMVMTGFTTFSYAREYPSQREAERICEGLCDRPFYTTKLAQDLHARMLAEVKSRIIGKPDTEAAPDTIDDPAGSSASIDRAPKGGWNIPDLQRKFYEPLPLLTTTRAHALQEEVRLTTLPMAFLMFLALLAFGLGLDHLNGLHFPNANADLAKAVDTSEAALLAIIGMGMLISYGIATFVPVIRLMNCATIEAAPDNLKLTARIDADDAQALGRALTGRRRHSDDGESYVLTITDKAAKTKSDDKKDDDTSEKAASDELPVRFHRDATVDEVANLLLRRYIGADETKFKTILKAPRWIGAPQSVLGEGIRGKFFSVVTVLAPLAPSALFAIFK